MNEQALNNITEFDDGTISAISISCECGHEVEYDTPSAASRWRGELIGAPTGVLLGWCPECLDLRFAKPAVVGSDDDLTLYLVLHEVAMEGDDIADCPTQRRFQRELDEILGVDDLSGVCADCRSPLHDEDRREGPGAPEIGWEYYECPDCGTKLRPARVEGSL